MTTPRQVPDELWEEWEQESPAPPSRVKGGRQRGKNRKLLDVIIYFMDRIYVADPLSPRLWPVADRYDRFVEWKTAGIFEWLGARCLQLDDQQQGIDWQWQAADGTSVRAALRAMALS